MTILTRLRYLLGVILVLGVVAALLLHLNQQISTVHGVSATVKSRSYSVGTDYSGVLVDEYVEVGERVKAGDRMFVVKSNQLSRDISNGALDPAKSPYEIRGGNRLVVRATAPGKVVDIDYLEGAFLPVNAQVAQVEARGTTYVEADFQLTPEEYALIRKARRVTVTLPNQRQVKAEITSVSVHTDGKQAQTRVEARTPALNNKGLFASGTPVEVQVQLRRNGLVHSAKEAVSGLLTPEGQR